MGCRLWGRTESDTTEACPAAAAAAAWHNYHLPVTGVDAGDKVIDQTGPRLHAHRAYNPVGKRNINQIIIQLLSVTNARKDNCDLVRGM